MLLTVCKCSGMTSSSCGHLPVGPVDLRVWPLDQQPSIAPESIRNTHSQPHPGPTESQLCGHWSNCVLRTLPSNLMHATTLLFLRSPTSKRLGFPVLYTSPSETLLALTRSPRPHHSAKCAQQPAKAASHATHARPCSLLQGSLPRSEWTGLC